MRLLTGLAAVVCACAQQPSFTLDQVLGAPFPSEMTASPSGAKVAWISNARGLRNILVAEAPAWQTRKITDYTADDGQELSELRWTPDSSAIVYVRGLGANGAGDIPNPALDTKGAGQAIWIAPLGGGSPRKLAEGEAPAVSPKSNRVAFLRRGQIWMSPLEGSAAPVQAFKARGQCGGFDIRFSAAANLHGECRIQNRTGIMFCRRPLGCELRKGGDEIRMSEPGHSSSLVRIALRR